MDADRCGSHGKGPALILPPERHQREEGIVPLEHERGDLDVASITVRALLKYMTNHRIPMDARIAANTFHDKPFLELTWEPPS